MKTPPEKLAELRRLCLAALHRPDVMYREYMETIAAAGPDLLDDIEEIQVQIERFKKMYWEDQNAANAEIERLQKAFHARDKVAIDIAAAHAELLTEEHGYRTRIEKLEGAIYQLRKGFASALCGGATVSRDYVKAWELEGRQALEK